MAGAIKGVGHRDHHGAIKRVAQHHHQSYDTIGVRVTILRALNY